MRQTTNGIILSFLLMVSAFSFAIAQSNGDYRSAKTGDWNDTTAWQKFSGGLWAASPDYPLLAVGTVTIQSSHVMTVKGSNTVASLVVNSGGQVQTAASGDTLWLTGASTVQGYVKDGGGGGFRLAGGSLAFGNGSVYEMANSAPGILPIATWGTGSKLLLTGIVTVPGVLGLTNANQDFYNVTFDCPNLTSEVRVGWSSNTIHGDLVVKNTNDKLGASAGLNFLCLSPKSNSTVTVLGNLILDSTTADISPGTGSTAFNDTLIVFGNITSKGVLYLNGSGVSNKLFAHGNITILNGLVNSFRGHSASTFADTVFFAGTGVQRFIKPFSLNLDMLQFRVLNGSTLYLDDTTVIKDAGGLQGTFTLDAGATLQCGHPGGINGNVKSVGAKTFNKAANYEFNGTTAAQVTGTLLPDTVNNLKFSNLNGDTLTNAVMVNGTCTIASGSSLVESAGKYVKGITTTMQNVGAGASLLGGIGVSLNAGPDNIGNVTITRTSGSGGIVTTGGKSGIKRKWVFFSTNPPSGGRDLTLTWDANDDNGKNLSSAQVWFSTNGTSWTAITKLSDLSAHTVTVKGVKSLGQWTISDSSSPLGGLLVYSTKSVSFGNVVIGSNKKDSSVVMTNNGVAALNVTGVASNDAQLTASPTTFSLSQGATQKLLLTFAPTTASTKKDTLLISVNGVGSVDTILVTATGVTSLVRNTPGSGIPTSYELLQNYPNPFNPTTTISFALPERQYVSLTLFDPAGREVAVLFRGEEPAGSYSLVLDAHALSSGLYFYRLQAGSFIATRKMTVIK